jgi:hypothetical protein
MQGQYFDKYKYGADFGGQNAGRDELQHFALDR